MPPPCSLPASGVSGTAGQLMAPVCAGSSRAGSKAAGVLRQCAPPPVLLLCAPPPVLLLCAPPPVLLLCAPPPRDLPSPKGASWWGKVGRMAAVGCVGSLLCVGVVLLARGKLGRKVGRG